jgi:hypothetical protein
MRKFQTEIIRERDAQGRLSGAGLRWVEARFAVQTGSSVLFWLATYFGTMFVIVTFATEAKAGLAKAAIVSALAAAGAIAMLLRWGTRERAVILRPDRIEMPHGQPRARKTRQLPIAINDIGNIETWFGGGEFWLLVYTRDADAHVLGRGLTEFQVRKVVTQLSHARDDLREALAQPRSGQPAARRTIQ